MSDQVVVLLHPFPFDSRVFQALAAALPQARLLTPDLVGEGAPTLDTLADQVIVELDRLGIDRAVVGGVSMGGYVTLNLLRRFPERLAGLILIDTKATPDAEAALQNRAAVAERADRGIRPVAADLLATMLSPVTTDSRPEVVRTLTEIIDAQPVAGIAWNQRAMAGRPDSTLALQRTDLPVLVVVGADDRVTPPAVAAEMAAAARADLVEVTGTGHLAVAEDPGAVAEAIRSWLSGV